jgi:hypothetical protein
MLTYQVEGQTKLMPLLLKKYLRLGQQLQTQKIVKVKSMALQRRERELCY